MMKRLFATILILLTVFLLTACGNDGSDTQDYLDILQSGTYMLSGNGTCEGVTYTILLQYVDGENFNIRYKDPNGTTFHFIHNNGVTYRVVDSAEVYAIAEESALPHNLISNIVDYDYGSAEYTKSSKTTVQGITYNYDIYSINNKDSKNQSLYIYTTADNGVIYSLTFPEESITIGINQLISEIPDDIYFEMPAEYQEVEYEQLNAYPEF